MADLPAITGLQLIRLLEGDGWVTVRQATHGQWLRKEIDGHPRFTTVKPTREPIPRRTLHQILGPKQTGLGADGFRKLLEKRAR